MQLGPSFHQSSLSPGQTPSKQLYGVNAVHGLIIAMVGVKMGRVMRPQFAVHADDDSVKATQFRHKYVDQVSGTAASASPPNVPNGCLQQIAANRLTIPQNLAAILLQGFVLPASLALREGWNRLHSRFLATCVRAMTEPLSRAGKTP
jgi:hypothetical protein